jgi:hypothetical protein
MHSEQASGIGNESAHWRTGTLGMTQSTSLAAVCAMRRAPHEGQMSRGMHEKATTFSCAWWLCRFRPQQPFA